jgi:hypothetical protein
MLPFIAALGYNMVEQQLTDGTVNKGLNFFLIKTGFTRNRRTQNTVGR